LDKLGTPYVVDPTLVRGLDYYTRTLFEFRSTSSDVGAQNALGGGGRYDGLVAELGGPKTPAIGFAVGIERTLLTMKESAQKLPDLCVVAPMGAAAASEGLLIARELRTAGVQVDLDSRGGAGTSLKAMLRRANSMQAAICLVLGDSELASETIQVKDLAGHAQHVVPRAPITAFVTEHFAKGSSTGGTV
jgi:histidyl-tRNA synthetase